MRKISGLLVFGLLAVTIQTSLFAQEKIIDQIVAIVGESIILESDIESQYLQMKAQGMLPPAGDPKCQILEDIMLQKLLLHQAKVDSLVVDEGQVDRELDGRLEYFIRQIGSREKLEQYFHKSYLEIKEDFRDPVREQLLTQQMQSQIISDVKMTPGEVRAFYRKTPRDSLPDIPVRYEIQEIKINPPYSEEARLAARQKLLELRKRIVEGENFATLAILYSEDPGSASHGGDLGFQGKAELDKDFAKAAFSLKKNQVSPIVETKFGYHIIQMIERQGDRIRVRHILVKPKLSPDAVTRANDLLDSVAHKIRVDSLTFKGAAWLYSEDENTKTTGGLLINPQTGDTRFDLSQVDQTTASVISKMKEGEVSDPFQTMDQAGNIVFKIIKIKKIIPAHKANLDLDYDLLQNMAKSGKQQQVFTDWVKDKQKTTYIRIDDAYKGCDFTNKGWIK
ncbi:MAG: peptidylprolyl isomerase [Chlorobi bacterium]|nr:peptidylprolyl isomerase [Chlorobiota bacterium]